MKSDLVLYRRQQPAPFVSVYGNNPFANDKILDWSKFKALADNKINLNQILKFDMGRVENMAGKGENAGFKHFLLFPKCF